MFYTQQKRKKIQNKNHAGQILLIFFLSLSLAIYNRCSMYTSRGALNLFFFFFFFFGGCVPTRVSKCRLGSRERIFFEKSGSWERKFEKKMGLES